MKNYILTTVVSLFICCITVGTYAQEHPYSKKDSMLVKAFKEWKSTEIKRLLIDSANVNAVQDILGRKALIYPAQKGDFDMFQFILKYDPGKWNDMQLLLCGIEGGNIELVKYIIEEIHVSPSQLTESWQANPLSGAIRQENIELVDMLIINGARVDKYDGIIDKYPLQLAIEKGNPAINKELLRRGVDVNRRISGQNFTMLELAVQSGNVDLVKLLLEYKANVFDNYYGHTPTYLASAYGYNDILKLLVEYGAGKELENYKGFHCLVIAAEKDHYGTVKYLLKQGAGKYIHGEVAYSGAIR